MSEGYGSDIWCIDSLAPGRTARDATVVVQALYRRVITPRGTLRGGDEEEAYGLDLAGLVGSSASQIELDSIPSKVIAEFEKDDRVESTEVSFTQATTTEGLTELTLTCVATLVDEEEDFTFTLLVTEVSVDLIGGTAS